MFASDATRLGIRNDTVVVAYDDYRNVLAGRVVWALRAYGHRRAHVLDGGLRAWVAAGHELRAGRRAGGAGRSALPAPASAARPCGRSAEMQAALDRDVLILDARAHDEYAGIESHARRHGHVPGAVNVPYRDLLDGDGPFRPPDALRRGVRRRRDRRRPDRPAGRRLLQRRRLGDGRRHRARARRRPRRGRLRRLVERVGQPRDTPIEN